jgi:hypothetical protein
MMERGEECAEPPQIGWHGGDIYRLITVANAWKSEPRKTILSVLVGKFISQNGRGLDFTLPKPMDPGPTTT